MIYIVKILALLIGSIVLSYTPTLLASFSVFVCLCIYFPDGDPVKSETCRRDISDKWLFIYCAFCWIKYCIADCKVAKHIYIHTNTGSFVVIVGVLTTCHTKYTWDRSICVFFYLIEQHSKFLLHTLQVPYMCTLCDSTNNTIIEFVPKCL